MNSIVTICFFNILLFVLHQYSGDPLYMLILDIHNPTWYQFLTYGMIHDSWIHVMLNSYFLIWMGNKLSKIHSQMDLLVLYIVTNVIAGILIWLFRYSFDSEFLLGSSAYVFAIIALFAWTFADMKIFNSRFSTVIIIPISLLLSYFANPDLGSLFIHVIGIFSGTLAVILDK